MSINYEDGLIVSSWAYYFNSYSGEHPIVWRSQAYRLVFKSVGVKMRVQVRKSGVGLAFVMLETDLTVFGTPSRSNAGLSCTRSFRGQAGRDRFKYDA